MLTLVVITSSTPLVYTAESRQIARRLWKETIDELLFAGASDIVNAFLNTSLDNSAAFTA